MSDRTMRIRTAATVAGLAVQRKCSRRNDPMIVSNCGRRIAARLELPEAAPRPQTRANHADSTGTGPRFEDHGRLPVSRIPKTAHYGRDKGNGAVFGDALGRDRVSHITS